MNFPEAFGAYACFGDRITCNVNGFDATARIEPDEDATPPWAREDGHGPVSEWVNRRKEPGERVLTEDGRFFRYYNIQEATVTARRDGWDTPPFGIGTPGERAARAVEADFRALRLWCSDKWHYCGIVVEVSRPGITLGSASLWGIELNHPNSDNSYLTEVANELLHEALGDSQAILTELGCIAT